MRRAACGDGGGHGHRPNLTTNELLRTVENAYWKRLRPGGYVDTSTADLEIADAHVRLDGRDDIRAITTNRFRFDRF